MNAKALDHAGILVVVTLALFVFLSSGLAFHLLGQNESNQARPPKAVALTPTPCQEEAEYPNIVHDKYITRFNGEKLDLRFDYFPTSEDNLFSIDGAKIVPLGDGGLLVNTSDTLYRFDKHRQVVWAYERIMVFDLRSWSQQI
jgi:hypothetical protein